MKYRIYIDEVGNHDLNSADNPNERFLGLTGIIFELGYVRDVFIPEFERLKEIFINDPDEPIIFHRKEIVNAKHPFEALRDDNFRKKFDDRLLSLIRKLSFTVISVTLDKLEHRERYQVWHYHPYHYCLAIILERYLFFLESNDAYGDAIAESRGGKEDMKLKDSYARLWEQGTDYIGGVRFQKRLTSKNLKVKPKSANIAGLQLADLLAHPCRQKILVENNLLPENRIGNFARKILKCIAPNFYRHPRTGTVNGYGRKLLP